HGMLAQCRSILCPHGIREGERRRFMPQTDDDGRISVGEVVRRAAAHRAEVVRPENRMPESAHISGVEKEPVLRTALFEPIVLGMSRRLPRGSRRAALGMRLRADRKCRTEGRRTGSQARKKGTSGNRLPGMRIVHGSPRLVNAGMG